MDGFWKFRLTNKEKKKKNLVWLAIKKQCFLTKLFGEIGGEKCIVHRRGVAELDRISGERKQEQFKGEQGDDVASGRF